MGAAAQQALQQGGQPGAPPFFPGGMGGSPPFRPPGMDLPMQSHLDFNSAGPGQGSPPFFPGGGGSPPFRPPQMQPQQPQASMQQQRMDQQPGIARGQAPPLQTPPTTSPSPSPQFVPDLSMSPAMNREMFGMLSPQQQQTPPWQRFMNPGRSMR